MRAPIRRMRSGCCARAASGQTAAPTENVTNSRRLILSMGISSPPLYAGLYRDDPRATLSLRAVFFTLSLAQADWQVLGPVLNRSESGRDAAAFVNPNE